MLSMMLGLIIIIIMVSLLLTWRASYDSPGRSIKPEATPRERATRAEELSRGSEAREEMVAQPQVTIVRGKSSKKKNESAGEKECRRVLESYFAGKKFVSVRPTWLVSTETGRALELDCYNEELSLAVEYNGQQHYTYPNRYHKSQEEFKAQVWNDEYKAKLCKAQGVKLITVPYTVALGAIESYLCTKLRAEGFDSES